MKSNLNNMFIDKKEEMVVGKRQNDAVTSDGDAALHLATRSGAWNLHDDASVIISIEGPLEMIPQYIDTRHSCVSACLFLLSAGVWCP